MVNKCSQCRHKGITNATARPQQSKSTYTPKRWRHKCCQAPIHNIRYRTLKTRFAVVTNVKKASITENLKAFQVVNRRCISKKVACIFDMNFVLEMRRNQSLSAWRLPECLWHTRGQGVGAMCVCVGVWRGAGPWGKPWGGLCQHQRETLTGPQVSWGGRHKGQSRLCGHRQCAG